MNEDYKEFYGENFIANLVMFGSSDSSLTGSMGFASNKIEENSELIILFKWDGESNHRIEDVDYFVWSSLDGVSKVIDKTGIGSYADDTALDDLSKMENYQLADEYPWMVSKGLVPEVDQQFVGY